MEQQQTVAFIDTETLGLDPEYHPVWEVAVIVDGDEHTWFQRVGPRAIERAETTALDMTGFAHRYDDDAALDPHESIARFCELTAGRHLVGMCPWFDSERLHRIHRTTLPMNLWPDVTDAEGKPNGYGPRQHPWHYHLIDVETMIVGYMQGMYSEQPTFAGPSKTDLPWKSEDLVRFLGVDPDDPQFQPSHQALTDARLARACWHEMMGWS